LDGTATNVTDIPFFGEIAALLTALCWSGSSLIFSTATIRLGSVLVNISRLVFALIYLGILILALSIRMEVSTSQVIYFGISGIIGLAVGDSFLFRAYLHIGPRLSMLVMSVAPAISAVFAWFMIDEKISLLGIAGIAITVAGVVLVVYERSPRGTITKKDLAIGVFSAGIAAAGQGIGLIFAKLAFMEGPVNGFVAATVRITASLIILLPTMLFLGRIPDTIRTFSNDRKGFWLTAAGSVLGPFAGISFSLLAVAYTKVGIAATLMATVPIIMLPMVRMIYKEHLTVKSIVGACIAVGGVAILFLH
jgi:drug/metabolite transporter (DMT)-like permease